jgi:hypothetical protein
MEEEGGSRITPESILLVFVKPVAFIQRGE